MRLNVLVYMCALATTLISASARGEELAFVCNQPAPACAPACCDCDQSGCGGERNLIGGVEAVFLKPYYHNNVALRTYDPDVTRRERPFTYDFEISPRVWLGYVGDEGLGVRVRYWGYDQTSTITTDGGGHVPVLITGINFSNLDNGDPLSDRLQAYTLDGDVTQAMCLGSWQLNFGGGIRGISKRQETGFTIGAGLPTTAIASIKSEFDGVGPTLFLETKRPIGCSGLALLGNVRGSCVFGDRTTTEELTYLGTTPDRRYERHQTDSMGIGEIQLGIEWSRCLSIGGHLAVQGLWEGQLWTGAGGPWGQADDMGLMGFTLGVGITR